MSSYPQSKQAILGVTGDIGRLLAKELLGRGGISVEGLSRNALAQGQAEEGVKYALADAEDADSLLRATQDIDVLYAVLSVPYRAVDWQSSWPVIMRNLIRAAKGNKFKLVFLDSVYMYGKADGPMTEDTPINPSSKKGRVRAEIAGMLVRAMNSGEITAAIGRSADFYGPGTRISSRFFEGTHNEGTAYWIGSPNVLRTLSYTRDNARALAILGNDSRADRGVWHMPAAAAMKGTKFIALAEEILGRELKTVPVPGDDPAARKAFAASMPEVAEMMYQYESDYIFDSSKFQSVFGMRPTSYGDGFRQVYGAFES